MDRECIQQYYKEFEAWMRGETIQFLSGQNTWNDTINPCFRFPDQYRIKPIENSLSEYFELNDKERLIVNEELIHFSEENEIQILCECGNGQVTENIKLVNCPDCINILNDLNDTRNPKFPFYFQDIVHSNKIDCKERRRLGGGITTPIDQFVNCKYCKKSMKESVNDKPFKQIVGLHGERPYPPPTPDINLVKEQ